MSLFRLYVAFSALFMVAGCGGGGDPTVSAGSEHKDAGVSSIQQHFLQQH